MKNEIYSHLINNKEVAKEKHDPIKFASMVKLTLERDQLGKLQSNSYMVNKQDI